MLRRVSAAFWMRSELHERFHIQHPTLQIELGERPCKLAPAHVV